MERCQQLQLDELISDSSSKNERRNSPRYKMHENVWFISKDISAEVIDISESGMSLRYLASVDKPPGKIAPFELLNFESEPHSKGFVAGWSGAVIKHFPLPRIKPEFWDDRKLAKRASRDARLLYIALWNLADEWGLLNGDPQWIKGQVFSYDDDLNADAIGKLLEELQNPALGAVVAYEAGGDPYLFLPKLARHQRLEPEKVNQGRSRLPAPPAWATSPRDPEPPPAAPPPPTSQSESRTDSSERRADSSERDSDQSGPGANSSALLYVMGAGSREHVGGVARPGARAGPVPNAPITAPAELPDDWKPSDALLRWANATYPGLDLNFETDQFCRHWRSEGRRKKSWPDAWQKWVADSHAKRNRTGQARASPAEPTTNARVRAGMNLAAKYARDEHPELPA